MITSDQIAIASGFISLISMLIAWRSHSLARKSYLLSRKEHEDRYRNIEAYLIKGIKWKRDSIIYSSFAISYTNKATIPSSLKTIQLEVEYYDKDKIFNKIKIDPEENIALDTTPESFKKLTIPLNIKEKESISGWITFKLPSKLKNNKIKTYRVCAYTSINEEVTIEAYLLTVIYNEKI